MYTSLEKNSDTLDLSQKLFLNLLVFFTNKSLPCSQFFVRRLIIIAIGGSDTLKMYWWGLKHFVTTTKHSLKSIVYLLPT